MLTKPEIQQWKVNVHTLCSMPFSFRISKKMQARCSPVWLPSTKQNVIMHDASTALPSVLHSIKWAVTALKPSRFGLVHKSVVSKIFPSEFYRWHSIVATVSKKVKYQSDLHSLLLSLIPLLVLLKNQLCCLQCSAQVTCGYFWWYPYPYPAITCTHHAGTGLLAGQPFHTQGIPVPTPMLGNPWVCPN